MYRDRYHPKVKKDLKKIDPQIRAKIKKEIMPALLSNPKAGHKLVGDLSGLLAYRFNVANQAYRIAYTVDETEMIVYIQMIAKRGDFYTLLKKRV